MNDEVEELVEKLSFEIDNYAKALNKLKDDVMNIQNGSGEGVAYWNGELAYGWIKSALAHFDHDTVLEGNIRNCLDYLKESKL